jgi:hypothetical protein
MKPWLKIKRQFSKGMEEGGWIQSKTKGNFPVTRFFSYLGLRKRTSGSSSRPQQREIEIKKITTHAA